jgi:hypothetical protein
MVTSLALFNVTKVILSKGPLGFDVDIIAAISVAISALTMMEGRYEILFADLYTASLFLLSHAHLLAYGEMFAGQGWPMERPWITMCLLVFSSLTFIAVRSLLLVQLPSLNVLL